MLGMDDTKKFSVLTVKNEIVGKTERNEIDYLENHHTTGVQKSRYISLDPSLKTIDKHILMKMNRLRLLG